MISKKNQVSYDLRSNALAIAGRLDPKSDSFREISRELRITGRAVKRPGSNEEETASKIYRGVKVLMRRKFNEENKKCAAYCIDIALRLAYCTPPRPQQPLFRFSPGLPKEKR